MKGNFDLSELLKEKSAITLRQQLKLVWILSVPGILAQISTIIMQYIDAGMVGYLGANASASIGLVAPATWLINGLCHAACIGFTVQAAHVIGAGKRNQAKYILWQSIAVCLFFSVIVTLISFCISKNLPAWLGAAEEIRKDASLYFMIFSLSTPFFEMIFLMGGMLQSSGNMKFPAIMNSLLCVIDVLFNWFFIYVAKLGVKGAALGTAVSAVVVAAVILWYTLYKSDYLNLRRFSDFSLDFSCISKAVKTSIPVGIQHAAFSGALLVVSGLIAPLGEVALSAHFFGITAESFCFMMGYGIEEAAATLVGQSYGAKRQDLVRSFGWITVFCGMAAMSILGILMYFLCPFVFRLLTSVPEIQELAIKVLRIELKAEPLFAASIVASGALRGKGDTLVPGILNLISLWVIRLSLSFWLVKPLGLFGIWIAMATELCFRGIFMIIRLFFSSKKPFPNASENLPSEPSL